MFVHQQVGFNRVSRVSKFALRLVAVENFNNMKLHLELSYLTFTILFVLSDWTNCEPLSTVFVLETSDSDGSSNSRDSVVLNNKAPLEDPNTQIITDDSPAQLRSPPSTKPPSNHLESQHHQPHHQQAHNPKAPATQHQPTDSPVVVQNHHSNPPQSSSLHHSQQNHQSVSPNHTSNGSTHQNHNETPDKGHSAVTTSRRLEEESQLVGATNQHKVGTSTRSTNHQAQTHQAASAPRLRPSSSTTTTANPYDTDQNYGSNSTPKTEERLLISITSEDIDYKPPQKVSSGGLISGNGGVGSSGGSEEYGVSNQQNPHHHQKRKPSITISIQDANNKQNEDSAGPSAVIVRPSENGQSIVISTVGGTSILNPGSHHNNKFNNNGKPAIDIVTSPSHGHNNHNNNNEPPYREPIENPIHHQQHHTSTSTYRPSLVNEYNPINPNRPPITSSLTNEERPQRPVVVSAGGSDDNYESSRPVTRPPSVPIRPTNQELTGQYDDNNSELSKPVNSNNQQQQSAESKYPLNERNCGLVHETRIVGGDVANPDDFMWMAAIIKSKPKDGDARPFCGGSLITRRHILTAAHCLENLAPRDVLIRLGSYDFDDSTASSLSADFAIDQFRVPAQYSKKTHTADIAIMRLKTPLSLQDNYKTVCMPIPRRSYVGVLGTVTGYGSQSQTFRRAAPKLRQVTVPIWENRKCSVVYKKNLTESFLCAGYEEGGKDACQGDSGGPLMTEGPNEKLMIVGVVSHGIGCGSPGYPGVYTRTTTYLDWIEKNTKE